MKKLYITDLDGTLLNSDGIISEYSKKHLNQLIDEGIQLTIATARSLSTARVIFNHVSFKLPVILYNGAAIYDSSNKRFVHYNSIDKDVVKGILNFVGDRLSQPFILGIDNLQEKLIHKVPLNKKQELYLEDRKQYDDERDTLVDRFTVIDETLNIVFIDILEKIDIIEKYLKKEYGNQLTISRYFYNTNKNGSEFFYLDISSNNATKGKAIIDLSKYTNISLDKTVVFGDHLNDLDMFEVANKAIAVGNAVTELKEFADEIIGDNDEDSVVKYIIVDSKK